MPLVRKEKFREVGWPGQGLCCWWWQSQNEDKGLPGSRVVFTPMALAWPETVSSELSKHHTQEMAASRGFLFLFLFLLYEISRPTLYISAWNYPAVRLLSTVLSASQLLHSLAVLNLTVLWYPHPKTQGRNLLSLRIFLRPLGTQQCKVSSTHSFILSNISSTIYMTVSPTNFPCSSRQSQQCWRKAWNVPRLLPVRVR